MEFSDQDLRVVLNQALRRYCRHSGRIPIILGRMGLALPMLMFLVGGAIAATGILEWLRLMAAVLVRLGPIKDIPGTETRVTPKPLGPVFVSGFLSASWPPPACFMLA